MGRRGRTLEQPTDEEAARLALSPGQTVGVDLSRGRRFGGQEEGVEVRRAS